MKFIMSRDRTVVTRQGRSFEFVKNEPLHVPDFCWQDVISAGAVPEDELPEADPNAPVVPQGNERLKVITAAMKDMVVRNVREEFNAAGMPDVAVLSTRLGFSIDARERDAVWAAAQTETDA